MSGVIFFRRKLRPGGMSSCQDHKEGEYHTRGFRSQTLGAGFYCNPSPVAAQSLVSAEEVAGASMEARGVGRGHPGPLWVKGPLVWALNPDQLLLELDLLPEGTAGAPRERKFLCVMIHPPVPQSLLFFCTWPQSYLPRTTLSLTPGKVLRASPCTRTTGAPAGCGPLRDEADGLPGQC